LLTAVDELSTTW